MSDVRSRRVETCASRRGNDGGHAASVPGRARANKSGRRRTCMTGLTVKEAADIVAVLSARRRRVRGGWPVDRQKAETCSSTATAFFSLLGNTERTTAKSHEISSHRAFSPLFSMSLRAEKHLRRSSLNRGARAASSQTSRRGARFAGLLEPPTATACRDAKERACSSRFLSAGLASRASSARSQRRASSLVR